MPTLPSRERRRGRQDSSAVAQPRGNARHGALARPHCFGGAAVADDAQPEWRREGLAHREIWRWPCPTPCPPHSAAHADAVPPAQCSTRRPGPTYSPEAVSRGARRVPAHDPSHVRPKGRWCRRRRGRDPLAPDPRSGAGLHARPGPITAVGCSRLWLSRGALVRLLFRPFIAPAVAPTPPGNGPGPVRPALFPCFWTLMPAVVGIFQRHRVRVGPD